jgi:hypothetical protein
MARESQESVYPCMSYKLAMGLVRSPSAYYCVDYSYADTCITTSLITIYEARFWTPSQAPSYRTRLMLALYDVAAVQAKASCLFTQCHRENASRLK